MLTFNTVRPWTHHWIPLSLAIYVHRGGNNHNLVVRSDPLLHAIRSGSRMQFE